MYQLWNMVETTCGKREAYSVNAFRMHCTLNFSFSINHKSIGYNIAKICIAVRVTTISHFPDQKPIIQLQGAWNYTSAMRDKSAVALKPKDNSLLQHFHKR